MIIKQSQLGQACFQGCWSSCRAPVSASVVTRKAWQTVPVLPCNGGPKSTAAVIFLASPRATVVNHGQLRLKGPWRIPTMGTSACQIFVSRNNSFNCLPTAVLEAKEEPQVRSWPFTAFSGKEKDWASFLPQKPHEFFKKSVKEFSVFHSRGFF